VVYVAFGGCRRVSDHGEVVQVVQAGSGRGQDRFSSLILLVLVMLLAAGCAAKKTVGGGTLPGGAGSSSALSESELAGSLPAGSSLAQFRSGTLGGEATGPLDDIFFGYDAYDLSAEARERLASNAEWLQANPSSRVEIEGHCDSRGTIEYNLALGARRATSVRDYLVSLGIASSRITTISYGKELPACHAETASCWQKNRRAHFVLLS
jgi:peptidoglycan-associated lipoprotein